MLAESAGTLIRGELDDGRGLSRQAIFRHKHELDSGRTSSIATAYMGFDAQGEQIVAKRSGKILPWSELAKHSHKKIQLIDLAGKLRQCCLEIPVVIALTKIDIAPKSVARDTLQTIRKCLRQCMLQQSATVACGPTNVVVDGKMGMLVKSLDEAVNAAKGLPSNRLTPILPLSNVTGDGLANLRHLLQCVDVDALVRSAQSFTSHDESSDEVGAFATPIAGPEKQPDDGLSVEMPIDDTYQVPGAGFVIAGTIVSGTIKTNDTVKIAKVMILHHQTTITVGYQPMINCRTIRQTAAITAILGTDAYVWDRAVIQFTFLHFAEFLKPGMRFVFRDGQAKGIGQVVRVLPDAGHTNNQLDAS
ncbi:hypothetical protein DYB32_006398 [Aphanomyces invadans]|uniref:Elongation factor Tu, chloroplastic n=1 Tax=Aphanomyces invadans TaxID=157072 RepID=A0A3R6Z2B3_9STRA|nr:hypothetical protein DYB32_006398 [Aphanomyces invadans]